MLLSEILVIAQYQNLDNKAIQKYLVDNINSYKYNDILLFDNDIKNRYFAMAAIDKRCPRKLNHLPCGSCKYALRTLHQINDGGPKCEWYIHSANANYCFWAYQELFGAIEHTLEETAILLASTASGVNLVQNQAIAKILKQYPTITSFLKVNSTD